MTSQPTLTGEDRAFVKELSSRVSGLREQIGRRIVGLETVLDHMLYALFGGGHTLLIGVPGLAKTLLISTLAETVSLDFNRVQFTPDLMPSDITGTDIIRIEEGNRTFSFRPGPIFANIVLADEINRTPPKTQAALMEAMEEGQVSSGGHTYPLEPPFFVLATQNPIEQEGTYPLPIAQLDRFMFSLALSYPSMDDEFLILRRTTSGYRGEVAPALSRSEVLRAMEVVPKIQGREDILRYAMAVARATRATCERAPAFVREWLSWGGGPRATQAIILGAKARAMLAGREEIEAADIRAVAPAVLRHRVVISYNADADGLTVDEIVEEVLETLPAPDGYGGATRKRGLLATLFS